MEVYACSINVCGAIKMDSPLEHMTQQDWIGAQRDDPDVTQIIMWFSPSKLQTPKLQPQKSYDLKQFLHKRGNLELQDRVLCHHTNKS